MKGFFAFLTNRDGKQVDYYLYNHDNYWKMGIRKGDKKSLFQSSIKTSNLKDLFGKANVWQMKGLGNINPEFEDMDAGIAVYCTGNDEIRLYRI